MFAHFEFVHRRPGQQIAVNRNTLHHFLSDFFGDDALHCLGDEFQIALIRDLKFNFIPNVGEKRPGIIPNNFIEHFFVRESDNAAARMVSGNVLTAKFPERGVEISDVDDVTGGVADFNSIADSERSAHQNVNPGDEAFHRCLHGEANDDRADAERGERAVPIDEHD